MSVAVTLDELRAEVDRCGPGAFLLTVGGDLRPHVVAVRAVWEGDALVVGAGRRTAANVGPRPGVSLLWPAAGPTGYSLIVDGAAEVRGDEVVVSPIRAVLHRSNIDAQTGDPVDGPTCVPVLDRRTG